MRTPLAVAALVVMASVAQAREVLPFVENDYAKAVATARAKKLPLFVEAWAPW